MSQVIILKETNNLSDIKVKINIKVNHNKINR